MLNVEPDYFVSDYQGFIQADCGRKIKSIRIACGCGLNQFGRILGCTGEAVARWEKNICVPELKYYKQIEQAANDNGLSIKSLNETPVLIKDEYKEFCESEFGEVVKAIRRNYHMKQIDFGRMIGVSLSTIGNWETRSVIPDREHFAKLKEIAARKGVKLYDA